MSFVLRTETRPILWCVIRICSWLSYRQTRTRNMCFCYTRLIHNSCITPFRFFTSLLLKSVKNHWRISSKSRSRKFPKPLEIDRSHDASQQKTLLCDLFFVVSSLRLVRVSNSSRVTRYRQRIGELWCLLAYVSFALGLAGWWKLNELFTLK